MILAVDIGNSNIVVGGMEGHKIIFEARVRTDATKTSDEYCIDLKNILDIYGVDRGSVEGGPNYITNFTEAKMYLPIPASETVQAPALLKPAVPYYND